MYVIGGFGEGYMLKRGQFEVSTRSGSTGGSSNPHEGYSSFFGASMGCL